MTSDEIGKFCTTNAHQEIYLRFKTDYTYECSLHRHKHTDEHQHTYTVLHTTISRKSLFLKRQSNLNSSC